MWIRIHRAASHNSQECYVEIKDGWILPIEELKENTDDFTIYVYKDLISICWI